MAWVPPQQRSKSSSTTALDHPLGGRIDLDGVSTATRIIDSVLEEADPIDGAFTLEVSSPGLERALRTPGHFARFVGTTVSVKTHPGTTAERRIEGRLTSADPDVDGAITVDGVEIPYSAIERARTVFVWGPQPKPGSKGGGGLSKSAAKRAAKAAAAANSTAAAVDAVDAPDHDIDDDIDADFDDEDLDGESDIDAELDGDFDDELEFDDELDELDDDELDDDELDDDELDDDGDVYDRSSETDDDRTRGLGDFDAAPDKQTQATARVDHDEE